MSEVGKLNIPQRVRIALENAEFYTISNILKASKHDLSKLASVTDEDITALKLEASKSFKNLEFKTGLQARDSKSFYLLSVGCPKLDKFLRGGLATRGITEIVGESGSGKTQLCLQIALMVQYPILHGGLDGGAVYICTEGAFPSSRLHQLSKTFTSRLAMNFKKPKAGAVFGDNIFIEHIADAESLKACINNRLPQLLARACIKLVVIDSIAGAFRADYEPSSGTSRAKDLQSIGVRLHQFAEQFDLTVICVNQVTDVPTKESGDISSQRKPVPSLGLAWANMVTSRLQLSRLSPELRTIEVVFSPRLPSECCHFNVTQSGVASIE